MKHLLVSLLNELMNYRVSYLRVCKMNLFWEKEEKIFLIFLSTFFQENICTFWYLSWLSWKRNGKLGKITKIAKKNGGKKNLKLFYLNPFLDWSKERNWKKNYLKKNSLFSIYNIQKMQFFIISHFFFMKISLDIKTCICFLEYRISEISFLPSLRAKLLY